MKGDNEIRKPMDPTFTIEEVSRILKVSRHSWNDPTFRARIGYVATAWVRATRFLASDVEQVL